jgi:histidine kinase 2/3/4 (cytokinin receptor)
VKKYSDLNFIFLFYQFTKEGSILVCVRVMDYDEDGGSDFTVINVDEKTGDIQLSQVLPNETLSQVGVEKLSLREGNAPPRLSIHPGSESNCRDAVESWRKWKLKSVSGGRCKSPPNHFTIITSVEDTGANQSLVTLIISPS